MYGFAEAMPITYTTKDGVTYTLSSSSGLTGIYYNSEKKNYVMVKYSDEKHDLNNATVMVNVHNYSVNSSGKDNSNYSNGGATGTDALAAGVSAQAKRTDGVAVGKKAAANGERSIAIGSGAHTKDEDAQKDNIAIGTNAYAGGDSSVVIGNGAQTDDQKQRAVVLGKDAKGKGDDTIAAGTGAQAEGNYAVALGTGASAKSDGTGSVAIGYNAKSLKESTAVGPEAKTNGNESVALGHKAVTGSQYSVAIGPAAVTGTNDTATAIGYKSNANNQYAIALGANATANKIYGVALGSDSVEQGATENDNVKFIKINGVQRNFSNAVSQYAVSVGDTTNGKNFTRQIKSVANGEVSATSTDAINGSQLYAVAQAITNGGSGGSNIHDYSVNSTNLTNDANYNYRADTGANAMAAGVNAQATGKNSTAVGNGAQALANSAVAIGDGAVANGVGATVIGNGAQAILADTVALGSKSVANRAKWTNLTNKVTYKAYAKPDTVSDTDRNVWEATDNAIAVGNDSTTTRQITGVAAGSLDTDAVNVAQLKASGFKVTANNESDKSSTILNGDTLDFEAKDNAIVSTDKDSKTITVAVSRTPTFDSATFGTENNEKVIIINGQISAYNNKQQKRAVVGVDNQGNGTLFLVNDDLSQAHLYTQSSKNTGNDGITRMYYTSSTEDNGGEVNGRHTLAVLDDGINYVGDNYTDANKTEKVVVKHKLNSTMDITGGVDTDNLSDNNIGVVAVPAVEDESGKVTQRGKLEIKLNKQIDLTDKGSVTMGDTTINNGGVTITKKDGDNVSLTDAGLNNGNNKIINVADGVNGTDAVNMSQLNAPNHTIKYYSVDETNLPKLTSFMGNDYSNENNNGAKGMGSLAAGFNTHADGIISTVAGSYSGVINQGHVGLYDLRGATALSYGTFNINMNTELTSTATTKTYSGVANSIIGQANITTDSNAAIIYGAGNTVTNSYRPIETKKAMNILENASNPQELIKALQDAVPTSGGQVMVLGGGNSVDNAYMTQVNGVGNTVKGRGTKYDDDSTQLNYIEGFYTTLTNGKNDYIIGAHNNVTGKSVADNQSNIVFGDNHTLTNTKNNVILGSAGNGDTTTVSDVVSIGHNAKVSAEGGVAIGSGSVVSKDNGAGAIGYDPLGTEHKDDTTGVWKSTDGAVSVGKAEVKDGNGNVTNKATTRQLTNLAAGTLDTDAVNVAQLKLLKSSIVHTAVTVNDKGNATTATAGDNDYGKYAGSDTDNLLIAAKKDTTSGQMTYNIKLNDQLTIGKDGVDGKVGIAGKDGNDAVAISGKDGVGHIGLTGPKGENGADGTFVDIHTDYGVKTLDTNKNIMVNDVEKASRLIYTDSKGDHEVATMDDGLKFVGDDGTAAPVAKKLNETLQIRGDGTYDAATKTSNGNIKTSIDQDTIKVELNKDINLHQDGSLTVGGSSESGSTTVTDPIVIKHFNAGQLTVTGTDKDGQTPQSTAGDYITGLDNTNWDVKNPTYVSGRAATEDQLKKISDAVNDADTKAGKHTVVTVNDKANATEATAGKGDYGAYSSTDKGNLLIAAKDNDGQMTYNIKLNDQLAIGKDGKDGKVTVETRGGTTVVIGHDGKDGEDGKDGLFVTGKDGQDGKSGVSIIGPNGQSGADGIDGKVGIAGKDGKDAVSISGKDGVGHIGLTGPKGENGTDAIDIHTDYGVKTLDTNKNVTVNGKEKASRIIYTDSKGDHEVATMDDGLKFVGNDDKTVVRKLNTTLSIKGGITEATALQNASTKNLGVRSNKDGDGLEIVMTDTPDFTKVTVGGDTKKITIGGQSNSDTKNPANGNYITGLDNTQWDKNHVVENRAATEGQLSQAISEIKGADKGGFGLADENGNTVKKDLGQTITVKGDGKNIETKVNNGALEVSLKKDVDLTQDGSIKAGNTTINKDGITTNKVTAGNTTIDTDGVTTNQVKVGDISVTKDGIDGGGKQITNIASGITGNKYTDAKDNNAASIGDVKQLAQQAKASEAKSGKNITVEDDHTVNLNDTITLGDDKDASKQVSIDGKGAKVTAGDGANKVTVDGSKGQIIIGSGENAMTLGKQANTAGDKNPAEGNYLNGLDNKSWDGKNIQSGRAATEDQLKTVSDKVNSGRVFQGDDGQSVTVGMGETLNLKGGAKEVSSADNIGIVKGNDNTLNIRLAKDIKGLNSVTTGNTTINNGGLTIKTEDANRTITVQDGNVNMGGNQIHNVAPGQAPGDAVNVSQLNATNSAVNKLGNRINRVGAGAAALAALHPLDFDPDDKWDFAAGYGNYRGANAAAIGAYYRPNEDTMFSVGGSFGGGENMVNAGVSFKLGQGNHVSTSRVAMAKEIKDLRQDVANLNAIVNRQSALIDKLTGTNAGTVSDTGNDLFPDVPANHWAYEYVSKLKQAGILTGYPDGNFDGDRMMTRYEFAAIVYRAIMAGAASNPALNQDGTLDKLAKEFSPEMKYIRIDTIAKDKNDKPTIERVRVIPDAK